MQNLRAAPTYRDEEVLEEEEEQDARSYAGDDMADMHLHDDDFLSIRVVLQEEHHNEVISLSSSSLPMCSCYVSKLN